MKLERWRPDTALGAGLRTKDVQLESAEIFSPASGDIVGRGMRARVRLIVARPDRRRKIVVIGFEPLPASMKYELATPLLIANILRWMAPETFRRMGSAGGNGGDGERPAG